MPMLVSLLLALCVAVWPAQAADKKPPAAATAETIELSNLPFPVVREGRLENYIFTTVSVELGQGADSEALRKKAHIVRDSFLRVSHERSLALADDPYSLDPAAAIAALGPVAVSGFGAKAVKELKIVAWTSLRTRTDAGRSQSTAAAVARN